jgi:hypothetical protein
MMGGDGESESGAVVKVTRKSVAGPIDQAIELATALAREFL